MFYLNTIDQLFLFVEQLDQLEVCLPYSRLLNGIQILVVFQNLWWNSNKTTLVQNLEHISNIYSRTGFIIKEKTNVYNWDLKIELLFTPNTTYKFILPLYIIRRNTCISSEQANISRASFDGRSITNGIHLTAHMSTVSSVTSGSDILEIQPDYSQNR